MALESQTMWISQDNNGLCETILNLNKNVASVAIINKQGRPIEKISRPEFINPFPDYLSELFCMHCVLQISMGRDFDEQYGPINYHISERPNMTLLTFPLADSVIVVSVSKNIGPISLAKKIAKITSNKEKN